MSPELSIPTHLSVFVADPESGHPVTRLPLYAEVAMPRIRPPVRINDRFDQPLRAAVITIDPTASGALQDQIVKTAQEVLTENVTEASRNHLVLNPTEVRGFFQAVLKDTLVTAGAGHLADIPQAELKQQIVAALRRIPMTSTSNSSRQSRTRASFGPIPSVS